MSFSEQVVADIRAQANIVDVIGDYITLEKRGRNHFACCPFHQEDTPSFSVSADKQLFYCFGCHEGGDVFSFVMKHEGLSFQSAVLHVGKYTNVDCSSLQQETNQARRSPLQPYYDLMQFVSEFYAYMLQTDKGAMAKAYLTGRGMSEQEIADFGVGYAPDERLLGALLEEKGYSIERARELGLLFESKDMTSDYDAFAGRVVFPITDRDGHVVAFSGRVLEHTKGNGRPKYFHSPESVIFKKREILYNYSFVKNEIKKAKEVYVCEGIFDVIALARARVRQAICTLGTALSQEQLQLLAQMKCTVTFVYDNDNAGKHAALKALRLSAEHNITACAVTFWQYAEKDLDELLAAIGGERLRELLGAKQTVNDYYLQYYEATLNLANNEDKQQFVRKMVEILQYSNRPTQEHYYQIIQNRTGYSERALADFLPLAQVDGPLATAGMGRLNQEPRTPFGIHAPLRRPQSETMSGQERSEKLIIKGLLKGEEYIEVYKKTPVFSQNRIFRDIIWKIIDYFTIHQQPIDFLEFKERLAQNETDFLLQAFALEEPMTLLIFQQLLGSLQTANERGFLKEEASQLQYKDRAQQIEAIQQLANFKKKLNKSEEK